MNKDYLNTFIQVGNKTATIPNKIYNDSNLLVGLIDGLKERLTELSTLPSGVNLLDNTPITFPTLSQVERKAIRSTLTKNKFNITRTANELGIGRATLYRKVKQFGIVR